MKQVITTLIAFVLCIVTVQAQRQQYQQVNDIAYTESSDTYARERCKLDVYYPTDRQDAPVVVWFHGGGICCRRLTSTTFWMTQRQPWRGHTRTSRNTMAAIARFSLPDTPQEAICSI